MNRLLTILLLFLILPFGATAQKTKKKAAVKPKTQTESREVKKLRDQKSNVQQEVLKKKKQLDTTNKNAAETQKQVAYIEQQLKERVQHIHTLEKRIDSIDKATMKLEAEVGVMERKLRDTKLKYAEGLRYARTLRIKGSGVGLLLFVLQADSWQQMYRRARYTREYVAHQQVLGKNIMAQQDALQAKRSKLLANKNEMNRLLEDISLQRRNLMAEHRTQQQLLSGLKAQQKDLAAEIDRQQRRLAELDRKIDQAIAREIEEARLRAEDAERKRNEAETAAHRKSQATAKKPAASKKKEPASTGGSFITTTDRELSGSFERNRGNLPVPITGAYRIGARMGVKNVMKDVQLANKGVNYIGQRGAYARSIFDGEVSAVFIYDGLTNVLVRHGSYISAYCNLSSARVQKGQKVKAGERLGIVAVDESGETTLLFQLCKEKQRLNPEQWIAR